MGFDAFTSSGTSPLYKNSQAILSEHAFSDTAFLSATGATLSATASGIFDGLSAVEGKSYVIFGWGGAIAESSNSNHTHAIFQLVDEDGKHHFVAHTATDENGQHQLRQPIKVKAGSPVIYRVLDSPSKAGDLVYFDLYYTMI
jgi:hypothetical protein